MPRKSLLSPALPVESKEPQPLKTEAPAVFSKPADRRRATKRHIGAYFYRKDPIIIKLDKLGIDLDKNLQEMLYEAIQDYVDKHHAGRAFER